MSTQYPLWDLGGAGAKRATWSRTAQGRTVINSHGRFTTAGVRDGEGQGESSNNHRQLISIREECTEHRITNTTTKH